MEAVVARPVFIRELSIFFQPADTDVVIIATSIPIIISPDVLSIVLGLMGNESFVSAR